MAETVKKVVVAVEVVAVLRVPRCQLSRVHLESLPVRQRLHPWSCRLAVLPEQAIPQVPGLCHQREAPLLHRQVHRQEFLGWVLY